MSDINKIFMKRYMFDINKTKAKYLVLDLTSFRMREEENGPMEDPTILHNDKCKTTELWLRRINAGPFIMGSPIQEIGHKRGENQHIVLLTKPFYIGVFEITQKQYELLTEEDPSTYKGWTRPVESVSYYMIRGKDKGSQWPANDEVDDDSFLGMLRARSGQRFDLPTEAQWEMACKAGTITAWNDGTDITDEMDCENLKSLGRFSYNRGDGLSKYEEHAEVGSYMPNAWGLYDMHGNVWEWCLDGCTLFTIKCAAENFLINPVGISEEEGKGIFARIAKGGSWNIGAHNSRSASHFYNFPGDIFKGFGFRVVLNVNSEEED